MVRRFVDLFRQPKQQVSRQRWTFSTTFLRIKALISRIKLIFDTKALKFPRALRRESMVMREGHVSGSLVLYGWIDWDAKIYLRF